MADEKPSPEVCLVEPEDVQAKDPPPSYESVLGQYMTSLTVNQSQPPSLAYIDFMPRLIKAGNMRERFAPTFETLRYVKVT